MTRPPADNRRAASARPSRASEGEPLRFGLVGTGAWAAETHAVALANVEEIDFVGVWGRDPAKVGDLSAKVDVAAFPSYDALLQEVDAVAFAVPPAIQAGLACQAAAAGKHLLLEKPATLTAQAALRLQRAVSTSDVACLTFFTLRFDDIQRPWLEETAVEGPWRGAWSLWLSSALLPGGAADGSVWRMEKGALWDIGPHALSVIVPALGPVDTVYAQAGEDDLVHLVLRHRSNASSTLSLTLSAPAAASRVEFSLWGPNGTAKMPTSDIPYWRTLGNALRELVGLARSGRRDHPCDMRLSRHVVDILWAAENSLTQRRPLDVGV